MNCDINNDGRQDLAFFYRDIGLQIFFNRGFRCFGYAVELDLIDSGTSDVADINKGQQAGTIADFDGDGQQEVVVVSNAGEVSVLSCKASRQSPLSLSVSLPPKTPGPVNVTAYDGKRCLGTRIVSQAYPAFFGKVNKGPLILKWRDVRGNQTSKQYIVLKPSAIELPLDPH
jgi:hypothetical protein